MQAALQDSVMVITGASSGIGRATALELARHGGTAVVAARREPALHELALECEAAGGHALALPVDVSDEQAVEALARRAVETFGRVDVWVNNAAVTLFGRFEEVPGDEFRRVIETNLFGYVHGARAILPWFREQGRGVLINVSSGVGKTGQPFTSAYVVSKFGIIGLSESLRQELQDEPDIHVVSVLPASIDTPLFQQGANHTGWAAQAITPVYPARQVARAILSCARAPRREVIVGGSARAAVLAKRLAPALFDRQASRVIRRKHFQDCVAEPSSGNLFEPMQQYATVDGGWRQPRPRSPGRWMLLAGAAGLGLGIGLTVARRRR